MVQRASLVVLILAAGGWLPVTAHGQTVLEEIVVTAQKREENLQDVAISVSAFSGATLEDTGFDRLDDLEFLAPGVQFAEYGPIAYANMRGIGNENTTAGGDPGVALHIDGVYIGRPLGTLFSAFNSERVELLRGPQGTLYGRNATGGSINYVSRKPDREPGGDLDLTGGGYNWFRARGALNVPLGDRAAARVVILAEERDGYTDNFVNGNDANDIDSLGLRGHLSFDLSASADLLLSVHHIRNEGVGSQAELREPFPQPLAGPPIPGETDYILNGAQLVNDLRPFHEAKDAVESQDNELTLVSAQLGWDVGQYTIRSITGFAETSFRSVLDLDSSEKPLAELNLMEDAEQFTQELQVSWDGEGATRWIAGLYYFDEEAERRSMFFQGRFDTLAAALGVPSGFDVGGEVEARSFAVFGELNYDLSDRLHTTFGARYTMDEKEGVNRGSQFSPIYNGAADADWNEFTWKVNASYDTSESSLIYATISTGYKSGGVNQVTNPLVANPIYDPETVTAYEVGFKSRLLDNRLQLNVAAYHNDYEDLQFQVFLFAGPESYNASGATVQGLELELQAALTESLRLDATLGITDSEFDDQLIPVGGPNTVQIGGNKVQRTPDLTYSIALTNDWSLGAAGSLRARLDYSYTDEIFYNAFNRSGGFADPGGSDLADDYNNLNLRVIWNSPSLNWTVEAAVTNLTDEEQEGNVFRDIGFHDIPGGGGLERVTYNPPRQWSVRVGYSF